MSITAREMQKRSKEAQIKKYGGIVGYRKEMIRRGKLGGKPKANPSLKTIYNTVHVSNLRHNGKAIRCENKNCENKSTNFDWALKHGKEVSQNKNDYFQLCRSCHKKYDKGSMIIDA